ncbi:MAG: glycosyl transferase group 1 [Ramlibacter sp.]|nr:glycosyl transferase group 1 [Ramlibacter sp.]
MRITILSPPPNLSGGLRVVAMHARWLHEQGHEVRLAYPRGHPLPRIRGPRTLWLAARNALLPGADAASHFDALPVERIVLPAGHAPGDEDLPDADVVVATWWETAEWMTRLSPRKGAKAYFVQGHEIFDHLQADRVRATYRQPVRIITVSEWLRRTLLVEYGVTQVSLVPNGVDLRHFRYAPRQRNSPPTVGMLYSKVPIKGCDISIAAIRMARQRVPELRLVAFGNEDAPHRGLALPGPRAEYHCRPAQSLIPSLYTRCDAWLFGSRSEGFGLPILEAMACGTPVVASPAGAAPELLGSGGGMLVRPESPRAMADAIEQLCSCPGPVWASMSAAAVSTARQHSWEAAHRQFETALLAAAASVQPHRMECPA